MMKKIRSILIALCIAALFTAGPYQATASQMSAQRIVAEAATAKSSTAIFKKMPKKFVFASGAGGWSTEITLKNDGSFTGQFHDSDMGDIGTRYPNGTVYICDFSGKFSAAKRLNKYTYSMTLKKIKADKKAGKTYYQNGVRYVTSDPYGFDNGKNFRIYCPGIKMSKLPSGFVSWMYAFMNTSKTKTLPNYGIYNVKGDMGFFAWDS
ncbi:MAG: hypothetical protein HFH35_09535 [Eubacterium sp.]|nr:hypothetical protein [Eubacterium sp.]